MAHKIYLCLIPFTHLEILNLTDFLQENKQYVFYRMTDMHLDIIIYLLNAQIETSLKIYVYGLHEELVCVGGGVQNDVFYYDITRVGTLGKSKILQQKQYFLKLSFSLTRVSLPHGQFSDRFNKEAMYDG